MDGRSTAAREWAVDSANELRRCRIVQLRNESSGKSGVVQTAHARCSAVRVDDGVPLGRGTWVAVLRRRVATLAGENKPGAQVKIAA